MYGVVLVTFEGKNKSFFKEHNTGNSWKHIDVWNILSWNWLRKVPVDYGQVFILYTSMFIDIGH